MLFYQYNIKMGSKYSQKFKQLYLERYQQRRKMQQSWKMGEKRRKQNTVILRIEDSKQQKTNICEWSKEKDNEEQLQKKTIFMPSSFKFKVSRKRPSSSLDEIKQRNLQRQRQKALETINTYITNNSRVVKRQVRTLITKPKVKAVEKNTQIENETEMKIFQCSTHRRIKSETTSKNFRICFMHKQRETKKSLLDNSPNIDISRKTISSRISPSLTMKRKQKSLPEKKLKVNLCPWINKMNMEIKPWDTDEGF